MEGLGTAERALRTVKTRINAGDIVPVHKTGTLGCIEFALYYIWCAGLQCEGLPTPFELLRKMEANWKLEGNGYDRPDRPVDNFTNPSFSDLSGGDVK